MNRLPTLLACLLLAVFAAACGDNEQEAAAPEETATATPESTPSEQTDFSGISKNLSKKPEIPAPSGEPPAELQKIDIVKGKGKVAEPCDNVTVQYVGNSWSTGTQFDASWDRGREGFTFPLGGGQVIPGWDQGVAGMKVGGRRRITIPPNLAYGKRGAGGVIGPDETLVFVVDLVGVR
jgi:peptidylprolyl isomerase